MIKIQNLHFSYRTNKWLFENLNVKLSAGHIYGLLGKNGAGKSTLLKSIAGLVFPDRGEVEVLGMNPVKRPAELLQDICFIPEELYLPSVKIDAFVKRSAIFYPNFDHNYFTSLLMEFGIPQNHKMDQMSYGQKKKTLIAFGLATKARLIIMDEPTNGLDIPSKAQFRKIMATALNEDTCIIISTHQVRDLDNLIDTVIMLDEQKIALHASVDYITEKLCFKKVSQLDDSVIYAESGLHGHLAVTPNFHGEETKLDLELLFNAVLTQKNKIKTLFN
ncbi:MAG: ABC transporter ATP-binding protein [Pedobacter sp.]|nr:MAG: ABC transporter ATP-binding protein [Pedobacter sp.]